jgi:hypothetical protein
MDMKLGTGFSVLDPLGLLLLASPVLLAIKAGVNELRLFKVPMIEFLLTRGDAEPAAAGGGTSGLEGRLEDARLSFATLGEAGASNPCIEPQSTRP